MDTEQLKERENYEIRMSNTETNANEEGSHRSNETKTYDLEERTYQFAKAVRRFVKVLPRTICNIEDVKQVVRSSGSIGANYIEANDAISRKDFVHRIKICRKESKETVYYLRLLDTGDRADVDERRMKLVQESTELMKIFGAILKKSQ
jgi:four helix bundle protein